MLSWSSGKDAAWALYQLQNDPEIELVGIFSSVNKTHERVAMHGARIELLHKQAEAIGIPLEVIEIPYPCTDEEYEKAMRAFVEKAKANGVEFFAFGDLFLEDIRDYRIEKLQGSGIEPIFPIWGIPTAQLARDMVQNGLRSITVCIDPKQTPEEFVAREYNEEFLDALPESIDPCGENGEFHSFVFDGPMFKEKIDIRTGEVVHRDGFVYADVLPAENQNH